VLTLALGRAVVVLTVVGIAERRGSADLARTLYDQHEPSASAPPAPRRRQQAGEEEAGAPAMGPHGQGKPDKRGRRQAVALKRLGGDG